MFLRILNGALPVGFKDALATVSATKVGGTCSVSIWRDALEKTDAAEFEAALNSPLATTEIHKAMKAMGYAHADSAVQRHRRGGCACDIR